MHVLYVDLFQSPTLLKMQTLEIQSAGQKLLAIVVELHLLHDREESGSNGQASFWLSAACDAQELCLKAWRLSRALLETFS